MSVDSPSSDSTNDITPSVPFLADLTLTERIRAGDETAKNEFAARCTSFFRKLLRHSEIPPEDGDDVAHQAFLLAFDRIMRRLFRGNSSLETWTYWVIQGQIIEYWSKRRRKAMFEESLTPLSEDERELDQHQPEDAPLADWQVFEERLDVVNALRKLTEQECAVLLLSCAEHRSVKAISQLLDMSEYAVRKLRDMAREHFRRNLPGHEASFKPHTKRKRLSLLPTAQENRNADERGDVNGRSIETHRQRAAGLLAARHRAISRNLRMLCTYTQRYADSLLFWRRDSGRHQADRGAFA
ncbi:MAG: RNA polymerase sigma factor [Blastocatellia bacterium]